MRGFSGHGIGSAALPNPEGSVKTLLDWESGDGEKGEDEESRGEYTAFVDGVVGLSRMFESGVYV